MAGGETAQATVYRDEVFPRAGQSTRTGVAGRPIDWAWNFGDGPHETTARALSLGNR